MDKNKRAKDKAIKRNSDYLFFIGIDTGTNTGLAIWERSTKKFLLIKTMKIHRAMEIVLEYSSKGSTIVRVEDARLREYFGNKGREVLQGVGSVKRDASIWEDFLSDKNIDFEMVAPKNNNTKLSQEYFNKMTKWKGITSEHARDAAMLCYGY